MGGFRKAMPFTYGCMIIGGLALSGIPPFSGFFSKDEIIALEFDRGGWHVVLGVLGYVGAFLTAIYTFRMIFRAFHGEPCPEARGARARAPLPRARADQPGDRRGRGHRRRLPRPGAPHRRARAAPMKIAMGVLAVLAIVGGFLQIPGVTDALHHFLEPTFADSQLYAQLEPSRRRGVDRAGRRRADRPRSASPSPTASGSSGGNAAAASRRASRGLHRFFVNKWYFDEVIDFLDRPAVRLVRALRQQHVRARGRQRRASSAAAPGSCAPLSAAVRGLQSGYLRYYAALLLVGLSRPRPLLPDLRMTIHLIDPDLRAAGAVALVGALLPGRGQLLGSPSVARSRSSTR